MAPTKKAPEPAAPPSTAGDADSSRPSLADVEFIQQLLQLARLAVRAAHGETAPPAVEDVEEGDRGGSSSSHRTSSSVQAPRGNSLSQPSLLNSGRATPSIPSAGAEAAAVRSAVGGATDVPPSVQLHALLARALHAEESYWTDLRRQCEVDETASFMLFSAAQGYSALKAQHLLSWLRAYRGLVEGRREADDTVPETLLPELDTGNRKESAAGSGATGSGARKQQHRSSATARRRSSSGGSCSCSENRGEAADGRSSPAASTGDGDGVAWERRLPYEEALRQGLSSFLANEVEMGWLWARVPRQPVSGGDGASNGNIATTTGGAAVPPSSSGKKKPSRSERQRQQQLQQQELEEEQRRQAAAAALPPENVYLQPSEAAAFVEPFVQRGLLQHAALYEYMATHETQERPAGGPRTLTLALEAPADPPPLLHAVSFSVDDPRTAPAAAAVLTAAAGVDTNRGSTSGAAQQVKGSGSQSTKASSAQGGTTAPPPRGVRGSHGKEDPHHPHHQQQQADGEATQPSPPPPPEATAASPLQSLRVEQAKELAVLTRAHAEAVALAARRAQVEETHRAMELTFADRAGTTKAVADVYESLEREVQERQTRILQRVTALEISLGLRRDPRAEAEATPSAASAATGSARKAGGQRKEAAARK